MDITIIDAEENFQLSFYLNLINIVLFQNNNQFDKLPDLIKKFEFLIYNMKTKLDAVSEKC